jgi:hypothetical protein
MLPWRMGAPNRRYPMLRQKDRTFKRITWGEAVEIIAEKIESIKKEFGPSAMVGWPGADPFGLHSIWGNRFFNMYGSMNLISPGDSLCFLAGVRAFEYVYGIGVPLLLGIFLGVAAETGSLGVTVILTPILVVAILIGESLSRAMFYSFCRQVDIGIPSEG